MKSNIQSNYDNFYLFKFLHSFYLNLFSFSLLVICFSRFNQSKPSTIFYLLVAKLKTFYGWLSSFEGIPALKPHYSVKLSTCIFYKPCNSFLQFNVSGFIYISLCTSHYFINQKLNLIFSP